MPRPLTEEDLISVGNDLLGTISTCKARSDISRSWFTLMTSRRAMFDVRCCPEDVMRFPTKNIEFPTKLAVPYKMWWFPTKYGGFLQKTGLRSTCTDWHCFPHVPHRFIYSLCSIFSGTFTRRSLRALHEPFI